MAERSNLMTHYIDIRVNDYGEFSRFAVMNTLFDKFHKSLVDEKLSSVGVSFPKLEEETRDLGAILRIHGDEASVIRVIGNRHMLSVNDYISLSSVLRVPDNSSHRVVKRIQCKGSNPDRLRRRAMKRHGISMEEAKIRIPDSSEKRLSLPFLTLQSSSNGNKFRLFVEHGELLDKPTGGEFTCYGLSQQASVPWF